MIIPSPPNFIWEMGELKILYIRAFPAVEIKNLVGDHFIKVHQKLYKRQTPFPEPGCIHFYMKQFFL